MVTLLGACWITLNGRMGTERDLAWFMLIIQHRNGYQRAARITIASELKKINGSTLLYLILLKYLDYGQDLAPISRQVIELKLHQPRSSKAHHHSHSR